MDCLTANNKDIIGFLLSKGIRPESQDKNSFMYLSPLRNERTPSFKVDQVKNVWYDFGSGTGGKLIDLVCQWHNVNVTTALRIICGTEITPSSFYFDQHKEKTALEKAIKINHIQKLQNKYLIEYIESRGIPSKIASMYTEEIYYKTYPGQKKSFFAIAFKTDKGGYEVRNNIKTIKFPNGFKGKIGVNSITTIDGNTRNINVFEGFMDFLSALAFFKREEPGNKTIILNSLSNLRQLYEIIPLNTRVNLFLDNDTPGKEAAKELIIKYPNTANKALEIYPEFKDFNELICNQYKPWQ